MDIAKNVFEVLYDIVGDSTFAEEKLLKEDLGLDSLSLVAVIVEIEEKFGIEFKESDLDPSKILKVKDLIDLVGNYL